MALERRGAELKFLEEEMLTLKRSLAVRTGVAGPSVPGGRREKRGGRRKEAGGTGQGQHLGCCLGLP